ncbi:ribonuclease E activity regulator RraA [Parvibaculum sp. MBR-TMA-1.3b-4.2]|jgi:regulator of ribonuclease activity A
MTPRPDATTVPATTDLSDEFSDRLQYAEPVFADFGGILGFCGEIVTLAAFEDNTKVREAVESEGKGRVLVVDGGGSMRCALFGGNLGKLAEENGWAGVIINGCVRDTAELEDCAVGIKALAVHPRKSEKQGLGEFGKVFQFAGVTFRPGAWAYADGDGIVVSDERLA